MEKTIVKGAFEIHIVFHENSNKFKASGWCQSKCTEDHYAVWAYPNLFARWIDT
jgi:hypothetical protein